MCSEKQVLDSLSKLKIQSPENAQIYLKSLNISIIEAIIATRKYYEIDLGEAKKIVASHVVWKKEAEAGDKLHTMLIEELK